MELPEGLMGGRRWKREAQPLPQPVISGMEAGAGDDPLGCRHPYHHRYLCRWEWAGN